MKNTIIFILHIVLSASLSMPQSSTLQEVSSTKSLGGSPESVAWSALGNGTTGTIYAVAVSGENVYFGGTFTSAGGVSASKIAKWDGSSWSALGFGLNGTCYGIAVAGNDVYAVGSFWQAGGINARGVAKWNGTSWSAMGGGLYNDPKCIAISGSDVYVGGSFTNASNDGTNFFAVNNIAKWNGSEWSALGSGFNGTVYSLAVKNGEVYAGGSFSQSGSTSLSAIAKWNGSSWAPLGSGLNGTPYAIVINGDELFAGGAFTYAGGNSALRVAKWNGSSWSALGTGVGSYVNTLTFSCGALYAGGEFTTAGGNPAKYIAKWDGSGWSAVGSGTGSYVRAFGKCGGSLFVGGSFTSAGGSPANYCVQVSGISTASAAVGKSISGGAGKLTFSTEEETTAVAINLESGAGSAHVDVLRHSDAASNVSGVTGTSSSYRWVISQDNLASSFSGTVYFNLSDIPNSGISDPSSIKVYSRSREGSGNFTELTTSYNSETGEISASVTSFSEFIFGSSENPLPVELTSFSALINNDHIVVLNWTTASEVNNYGFEIQRSVVSSQRSVDAADDSWTLNAESWTKIGFVNGHGNSNSLKEYSFTDVIKKFRPLPFSLNYRLKQIDADGKFTYSEIVTVGSENIPTEFVLYQNYPNPFNPSTKIKFTIPTSPPAPLLEERGGSQMQSVSLNVYDVLGNEVATLVNEEKEPGVYEVEFSTVDFPGMGSGIYFYELRSGNYRAVKKLMAIK